MLAATISDDTPTRPERRVWSLSRPQFLFESNLSRESPDLGYWRNNFRMERNTFIKICEICKPFTKPADRYVRTPIILEKRHWLGWQMSVRI